MSLILPLLLLFPLLSLAMPHEDIVKQMNSPLPAMEAMSVNKSAIQVPLNLLFDPATKERIKKSKKKPKPKPTSAYTLFHTAYAFTKPRPEPKSEIVAIDLRSRDCPVVNQWNGTCTAHGLAAAMENLLSCTDNLSERHLWSLYKQYSVYPALKAAKQSKIVNSSVWPNSSEANVKPIPQQGVRVTKADDLGGNIDLAIQALERGNPVYVGMNTPKDLLSCLAVVRESTLADQQGGHSMAIVGFKKDATIKSGGYFILKNSWGKNCGDRGYQYLPFSYCSRDDTYCLFFEVSKIEKS